MRKLKKKKKNEEIKKEKEQKDKLNSFKKQKDRLINDNSNLERDNENLKNEIKLYEQELLQLNDVTQKLKSAEEEFIFKF